MSECLCGLCSCGGEQQYGHLCAYCDSAHPDYHMHDCDECGEIHDEENEVMTIKEEGK